MKKFIVILISVFLFAPNFTYAQKKKATATYPSYPARDDVFGKEVKFRP